MSTKEMIIQLSIYIGLTIWGFIVGYKYAKDEAEDNLKIQEFQRKWGDCDEHNTERD